MVRTCALISPIQPVLDRVSCSNERLPNAPKYCETHQNMSLGNNGEDRMCCEKFRCDFVAQTFTLIAPVQPILHQASCSNETIQNAPRHCETHQYTSLGSIGGIRCEKFWNDFMAQTCALIAPVQPVLHRVSCSNETLLNAPKHYETHLNMSFGSNAVDRVRSLQKIPMQLRGNSFYINCTSSTRIVSSFVL